MPPTGDALPPAPRLVQVAAGPGVPLGVLPLWPPRPIDLASASAAATAASCLVYRLDKGVVLGPSGLACRVLYDPDDHEEVAAVLYDEASGAMQWDSQAGAAAAATALAHIRQSVREQGCRWEASAASVSAGLHYNLTDTLTYAWMLKYVAAARSGEPSVGLAEPEAAAHRLCMRGETGRPVFPIDYSARVIYFNRLPGGAGYRTMFVDGVPLVVPDPDPDPDPDPLGGFTVNPELQGLFEGFSLVDGDPPGCIRVDVLHVLVSATDAAASIAPIFADIGEGSSGAHALTDAPTDATAAPTTDVCLLGDPVPGGRAVARCRGAFWPVFHPAAMRASQGMVAQVEVRGQPGTLSFHVHAARLPQATEFESGGIIVTVDLTGNTLTVDDLDEGQGQGTLGYQRQLTDTDLDAMRGLLCGADNSGTTRFVLTYSCPGPAGRLTLTAAPVSGGGAARVLLSGYAVAWAPGAYQGRLLGIVASSAGALHLQRVAVFAAPAPLTVDSAAADVAWACNNFCVARDAEGGDAFSRGQLAADGADYMYDSVSRRLYVPDDRAQRPPSVRMAYKLLQTGAPGAPPLRNGRLVTDLRGACGEYRRLGSHLVDLAGYIGTDSALSRGARTFAANGLAMQAMCDAVDEAVITHLAEVLLPQQQGAATLTLGALVAEAVRVSGPCAVRAGDGIGGDRSRGTLVSSTATDGSAELGIQFRLRAVRIPLFRVDGRHIYTLELNDLPIAVRLGVSSDVSGAKPGRALMHLEARTAWRNAGAGGPAFDGVSVPPAAAATPQQQQLRGAQCIRVACPMWVDLALGLTLMWTCRFVSRAPAAGGQPAAAYSPPEGILTLRAPGLQLTCERLSDDRLRVSVWSGARAGVNDTDTDARLVQVLGASTEAPICSSSNSSSTYAVTLRSHWNRTHLTAQAYRDAQQVPLVQDAEAAAAGAPAVPRPCAVLSTVFGEGLFADASRFLVFDAELTSTGVGRWAAALTG